MEWVHGYGKKSDLGVERASRGPLESTWAWQLHHTYLQCDDTSPDISPRYSVSSLVDVSNGTRSIGTEALDDPSFAFMHEVLIEEANGCWELYPYHRHMGNDVVLLVQQDLESLYGGMNNDLLLRHATENVLSRVDGSARDGGFGREKRLEQRLNRADVSDDAQFRATDNSPAELLFETEFDRYGTATDCFAGPFCKKKLVRGFDLSVNRYASSSSSRVLSSEDESSIASSINAFKDATGSVHCPLLHSHEAKTKNNMGRTTMAHALIENRAVQMFDANCNGSQLSHAMAEKGKSELQQIQSVSEQPLACADTEKPPIKSLLQTFHQNGAGTEIDCLQGGNECVLPPEKPIEEKEIRPGRKRGKHKSEAVIDLNEMLLQCAQYQQSAEDTSMAMDILNKLEDHVSQYGDGRQRVAYYFVEALKARIGGRGGALADSMRTNRAPASLMIKAYRSYVSACPYVKLAHYFGNQTILDAAEGASRLHIVDFGILYGFQWPSLIYALGTRPSGPPILHITGIDCPINGANLAEKLEDTGRRLADYARICRVPFEYQAFVFKGESLDLNDLNLREDEVVVLNCSNRLQHVMDEIAGSTARDTVLKNMRSINPKIFVLVEVNAGYNSPFFITRFKEALHHFSTIFDSLDNTMPKEDPDRFAIENKTLAHVIVGAVGCEGREMIERPEKCKQWESRVIKAGFKQLPVSSNIKTKMYNMLRSYHAEFGIIEEGNWLVSVWKGSAINAYSVWCPD